MLSEKLRIFVSGKEEELDDERATVIKLIESFGFIPVGSENRSASSEPIEQEFLGEVESSEIYIGIFGKIHSNPTINEFNKARERGIDTLVFEKDINEIERDEELKLFLTKIKDSKSGLYIPKYKNVIDLREKIISGLSYTLTKKFKIARDLRRENNEKNNEKVINSVKEKINLVEKMKKFPFAIQFSKEFGRAEFINFKILSEIKKGQRQTVSAKIRGTTKNGFLDLAIRDPDGVYYWFPDPHSYDSANDNGLLFLQNVEWEAQWEFILPDKRGNYLAIMGLYENIFTNREVVNYEIHELLIT